jgi:hypothetical protein
MFGLAFVASFRAPTLSVARVDIYFEAGKAGFIVAMECYNRARLEATAVPEENEKKTDLPSAIQEIPANQKQAGAAATSNSRKE